MPSYGFSRATRRRSWPWSVSSPSQTLPVLLGSHESRTEIEHTSQSILGSVPHPFVARFLWCCVYGYPAGTTDRMLFVRSAERGLLRENRSISGLDPHNPDRSRETPFTEIEAG